MRTPDIEIGRSYYVEWQRGEAGQGWGTRSVVKATARATRVKFKAGFGEKSNGVRMTLDARFRAFGVPQPDGTLGEGELPVGHEVIVEARHIIESNDRLDAQCAERLAEREVRYDEQDAIETALATLGAPDAKLQGARVEFDRHAFMLWATGEAASRSVPAVPARVGDHREGGAVMKAQQIGTVEVLHARIYDLDPERGVPGSTAIVEPGTYPLYRHGLAHFWLMRGELNGGGVNRQGDGLIVMQHGDEPIGVEVVFPSRRLGPDEFADLLAHDVCREGHPDQRLRIAFTEATDG